MARHDVAAMLGRQDLQMMYGSGGGGSAVPNSMGSSSISVDVGGVGTGQVSLTIVGGLVIGLVGFYFWTHKFQV